MILADIIQLEKEREEYEAEILLKEKNLRKLREELELAETEYNNLENSGIKKLLLGVVGKREEYLQNAMNELRRVRAEVANEEFFVSSSQNQIQQIIEKLEELESLLSEYETVNAGISDVNNTLEIFYKTRELPVLRKQIAEISVELKEHFEYADKINYYGDLRADMSGRRYNRKDTTMRETSYKIKYAMQKLIPFLDEYNHIVPEEIKIEFHEDWMDDENYWEGQQLAEDSYARIKKVDDWFFRFKSLWKKMEKLQNEVLEQLRNEVLEFENK